MCNHIYKLSDTSRFKKCMAGCGQIVNDEGRHDVANCPCHLCKEQRMADNEPEPECEYCGGTRKVTLNEGQDNESTSACPICYSDEGDFTGSTNEDR